MCMLFTKQAAEQQFDGSHSKARLLLMMGHIATKERSDVIPACKSR
jgi:hypothetical protein